MVLERGVFGIGASTRNGGMISGGTNLGKGLGGKSPIAEEFERNKAELMGAGADSLTVLEDIIAREGIECGLHKNGRFVGAWTPRHYDDMATKVETYNKYANAGASMVPRERQREFIQSDYYYGGMHATRAGHLHPALYYKGLIEAAHKQGAILCAEHRGRAHREDRDRLARADGQGADRVQRGRRGDQRLHRRSDAAPEAPRGAGGEPHHRHRGPARAGRQDADPRDARDRRHQAGADLLPALARRQAADLRRPRALHRRAAGSERPALYQYMIDRFPQLDGIRITHVWTGNVAFALDYMPHMGTDEGLHYLLGCNGNGVAMMTYLGTQTAKKIAGGRNTPVNPLDGREFPDHPLYNGDPSWFLPAIGAWYRTRDWIDRRLAG